MTAILLCAGSARRFGSQKLLARLPDGRYIVEAAAQNLLAGAGHVIAVTDDNVQLKRVLTECGCQVIVNTQAKEGMGTSIAAGVVANAGASADEGAWLIALGDMPYLRPDTIVRILNALNASNGIVVPTFEDMRGHPVAFAGSFGSELSALQGDVGARSVVLAHADRVQLLAVEDAGVIADIDTPEDLEKSLFSP